MLYATVRHFEGDTTDLDALKGRGCIVLQEKQRLLIASAYILLWGLPLVFLLPNMKLLYAWYFHNSGMQDQLMRNWGSNAAICAAFAVACLLPYVRIRGNGKRVKAIVFTPNNSLINKREVGRVIFIDLSNVEKIYAERFTPLYGVRLYFYMQGDQPAHVYRIFDPTTVETLKKLCTANNVAFKFRENIWAKREQFLF